VTVAHDVVIVGGGVMGCATAYHLLRRDPAQSIAIIEQDPTYRYASTTLSDGNVRIQFNLEENIRMSQYAMEVLDTFADDFELDGIRPDPACRHQGNLFTVDEQGRAEAEAGMRLQRSLGCEVEWLSAQDIADSFPLYRTSGLVGGTFSPRDGSVDPSSVLQGYRRYAVSLGAKFVAGTATRLRSKRDQIIGVALESGERIDAPIVLNAAGAWAAGLAETAGVDLPVEPVMRTVFVVETDRVVSGTLPSIFLPSGAYILPEGQNRYLAAWSRPEDPVGFEFEFSQSGFYDVVWPEIVAHLPEFDRLRVVGGWVGLYASNTLDGNAVLGEWPELSGLYLANGFSGHGFQQCHAVGRYLAELILDQPVSLDLSRFGPQRIIDDQPVFEHAGRII